MKLSELKGIILRTFGEKGWEEFKEHSEYLTYNATEKKVLEKMQLEVIKGDPYYYIQFISRPTEKVLKELINMANTIYDYEHILKYIENDLNEE